MILKQGRLEHVFLLMTFVNITCKMKIFKQIWKKRWVILTNALWIEHIEK